MSTTDAGGVAVKDAVPRILESASMSSDGARLAEHVRLHGDLSLGRRRGRTDGTALLAELGQAGLTGRGGARFPTAAKAATVAQAARGPLARRPLVVVNLMEGEPASHKDRVLACSVPHLVLDGAQVLARGIGAASAVVCVAEEHDDAARSLDAAMAERAAAGIDPVPLTIERPAGRYIAGEESALADWLDSGRGLPAFRPDRPSVVRVNGRPALIDNAETLAHAALIARYGADWYRSVGTPEDPGTTLVTVSGAVARPGVWEIEMGTPLATVLGDAGVTGEPTAVLVGGYGGTWVPPTSLGVPLATAPLAAMGASLGSGVLVALPAAACGLAETARIAGWMATQSAGQCGPCAFGLPAMAGDLVDLSTGRSAGAALRRLLYRLDEVDGRGGCRHPDFVVRLVRSALRTFAAEVDRHVRQGPCRSAMAPSVLPFP